MTWPTTSSVKRYNKRYSSPKRSFKKPKNGLYWLLSDNFYKAACKNALYIV